MVTLADSLGFDAKPVEIPRRPGQRALLIVWAVGAACLMLFFFVIVVAQSAMSERAPLGWEEVFEASWLLHLLAAPFVLLGMRVAGRASHMQPINTPNSPWRFWIGLGSELLALVLIGVVYLAVRGQVVLASVSIPRALSIVTFPMWISLALVLWPLGWFLPRPVPATTVEVESALRGILSEKNHGSVAELAKVLVDVVHNANQPEDVKTILANVSNLAALLHALAGHQIKAGTLVLGFGSDNTFGQVTVRDVVGGNQIIINLNVAGPPPMDATKE